MDRNDASALADLQMHWDEAYAIGLDGDIWLARFHGSADELRAHTSTELRQLIRADYAYRQQARRVRASAGATVGAGSPGDPDSDHGPVVGGDGGPDGADLDDDELDDDDYAAHFDSAHADSADADSANAHSAHVDGGHADSAHVDGDEGGDHPHDAEPHRQAGFSRAASPRDSYANLRGERMST